MKGILILNTGSPASPHRKDVRTFVETMLSDPLVMTVPNWFRPILVKGIIGPFRQFASAAKYEQIWDYENNESPLMWHANKLASALEKTTGLCTEVGMVYLNPSIESAFEKLMVKSPDLDEVIVLPLFPQYAESSYLAAVDELNRQYVKKKYPFLLTIIEPYFNHPAYIKAVAESMKPHIQDDEYILFNFHSLPVTHIEKGYEKGKEFDYVYQVKETVKLVQHELNLDVKRIRIVYSSAFGKKWLEPSLLSQVEDLAKSGEKNITVVSPGFAADNLETLYDIGIEATSVFRKNGGIKLNYIPCLNSEKYWVDAVQQIIL